MRCANCGSDNPAGKKFCGDCGAPLPAGDRPAPSTETSAADFAGALSPRGVALEPATGQIPEGERKMVTALFADIKGSTALMADLDPEEAREIIDPALQIMVDAVGRCDGYVVQSTGDGVFALFGAPVACEDHPQRALYAALEIQQELREYGQRRAAAGGPRLEARIGVNTGEVVVRSVQTGGKIEYSPIGHTANLASRLQNVAPPGSIAVSEPTSKLVQGYFELRALGPTPVKGIGEPVNVYEVTGLLPLRTRFQVSASRGLTTFVGRQHELAQMNQALELAISGRGQIVALVAEAGTGKSRLVHEFKGAIPDQCKLLQAFSVSDGKASAWRPVLELLRRYFSIEEADDTSVRREKVRTALSALDPALGDALPYLTGLLGIQEDPDPLARIDPPIKRQRTLDAIIRIIVREAPNRPVVVIFEDLQWIDSETQALLDALAESIANSRVLLLVNYRPEYRHRWANKSWYSQLGLDPLAKESAEEMLNALLPRPLGRSVAQADKRGDEPRGGGDADLAPIRRLIIERTEGNPFFIEEMVHALFDEGALVRNGAVKVGRPLAQLRLPPTVQGILAGRIDRLPAQLKQLLQTLAVMGRESPLGLIRRVASSAGASLEPMLAQLQAGEFIREQPAPADIRYAFKHALTQEVAYTSLLIQQRKLVHERVGQALESMFAGQLDDHVSELAHHYGRSNNVGKAVEYFAAAGESAHRRFAYREAEAHFRSSLRMVEKLSATQERDERELKALGGLQGALSAINGIGFDEHGAILDRSAELCRRLARDAELVETLHKHSMHRMYVGDMGKAAAFGTQALAVATRANDTERIELAHGSLGFIHFWTGMFARSRRELERTPLPDALEGAADFAGASVVAIMLSRDLWMLGFPDQSRMRSQQSIELAARLDIPLVLASAKAFGADINYYCGEVDKVDRYTIEVQSFLKETESKIPQLIGWTAMLEGWVKAQRGQPREALSRIRDGFSTILASRNRVAMPLFGCLMANVQAAAGQPLEALATIDQTFQAAEETGQHYSDSELCRLRGEFLLMCKESDAGVAEECFREALDIARRQQAKSWELRATMSLARLLANLGRRDEARTILAEIYGWFTEGFDTADLKEARALLDQLSR